MMTVNREGKPIEHATRLQDASARNSIALPLFIEIRKHPQVTALKGASYIISPLMVMNLVMMLQAPHAFHGHAQIQYTVPFHQQPTKKSQTDTKTEVYIKP